MPRLPRNTNPEYLRHISIRTEGAALFLLPDANVNQTIGGILAKYQEEFSIEIYAYAILGNHMHILARAPKSNLWRFEQAINREIAKRINKTRHRRGHFWERRYDEQIIPEENDAIDALLYVICNVVSHGLVEHPLLWPGLNCFSHILDERDRAFFFTNYTAYQKAKLRAKREGKRVNLRDFQTRHMLRLSPLPQFEGMSHKDRKALLKKLIRGRIKRIRKERKAKGLGFLGRKNILRQRFTQIPRGVKRMPRPICYTKDWEVKQRFMEWFFPWLAAYRKASRKFRAGNLSVQFPEDCIMPPCHYSLQPG